MSEPVSVTEGDLTITSTTSTEAQIRESLKPTLKEEAAAAAKVPAEPPVTETPDEKPDLSEAGRTLAAGKKGTAATRKDQIQAEINALVKQKGDTVREHDALVAQRDALKRELDELAAKKPAADVKPVAEPPVAAAAAAATAKPKLADFDDMDAWSDAVVDWTKAELKREHLEAAAQQTAAEQAARAAADKKTVEDNDTRAAQALFKEHQTRIEEAKAQHADFDEVVASVDHLALTPAMNYEIVHSELGGEIAYYLGQHHDEFAAIAALPTPDAQRKAMNKLEARIEAARVPASGPASPARPITRTAPPVKPLGGSGNASPDTDPADIPFGPDYVRRMNARERELQRR